MILQKEESPMWDQNKPTFPQKAILVIEDDTSIGELLVDILSYTSYKAFLASNGQQALQIAHTLKPALVITDYQLPEMSGIELYDRLQAQQELAHTPTIIMSADLPEHEIKKRNLVSLEKPFELDDLISIIEDLIEHKR